jgi:hypothetical protein
MSRHPSDIQGKGPRWPLTTGPSKLNQHVLYPIEYLYNNRTLQGLGYTTSATDHQTCINMFAMSGRPAMYYNSSEELQTAKAAVVRSGADEYGIHRSRPGGPTELERLDEELRRWGLSAGHIDRLPKLLFRYEVVSGAVMMSW